MTPVPNPIVQQNCTREGHEVSSARRAAELAAARTGRVVPSNPPFSLDELNALFAGDAQGVLTEIRRLTVQAKQEGDHDDTA